MNDIKHLVLLGEAEDPPVEDDIDRVTLQSDHGAEVESGRNYDDGVIW